MDWWTRPSPLDVVSFFELLDAMFVVVPATTAVIMGLACGWLLPGL